MEPPDGRPWSPRPGAGALSRFLAMVPGVVLLGFVAAGLFAGLSTIGASES